MKRPFLSLALVLTACDASPPPQQADSRQPNPVFESQIQAVEKARAVESRLVDAADAQKRNIEQAAE